MYLVEIASSCYAREISGPPHHAPKFLSSSCAEILAHGVMLDAVPKFRCNPSVTGHVEGNMDFFQSGSAAFHQAGYQHNCQLS